MPGALTLAVTLAQAAPAAPPPSVLPTEHRDPRPRTFDPPRGRYSLPDGTVVVADPPWGYYDPPPGLYPKITTTSPSTAERAARGVLLGPLPTPEASMPAWLAKRRRLRIALGISGGLVLATAIAPGIGAIVEANRDPGPKGAVDGYPPGIFIAVIGTPLAILSTAIVGVLLGVHNRRQPRTNHRLHVVAGGFHLSF